MTHSQDRRQSRLLSLVDGDGATAIKRVCEVSAEVTSASGSGIMFMAGDIARGSLSPRAIDAGFHSVLAFPMRLRTKVIGAVNLFCTGPAGFSAADVTAAQAFAGIATIAIRQHRAVTDAQTINAQLTTALNSRVVIEQAKGIVAERSAVPMDQAFALLRSHARNRNLRLDDVARSIIDGTLRFDGVDPNTPRPRP